MFFLYFMRSANKYLFLLFAKKVISAQRTVHHVIFLGNAAYFGGQLDDRGVYLQGRPVINKVL